MSPMVSRSYGFGPLIFRIDSPVAMKERDFLETFRVGEDISPDVTYEIRPETEARKPGASPVRLERVGNRLAAYMDISLLPEITAANFLSAADASSLAVEKGAFLLHAAHIRYNGEAILFTAPSGTGKSTQAHLWETRRDAEIINEDRALIFCRDGQYYAAGCWAMGSGTVCRNVTSPIRAIVLLGQGRENTVRALPAYEIFRRLLPQCTFDEGRVEQQTAIIDRVTELIGCVKTVAYDCVPQPSSVEALESWI